MNELLDEIGMTADHLVENIESIIKEKAMERERMYDNEHKRTSRCFLVERGLFETREQAKRSIMAGIVFSVKHD